MYVLSKILQKPFFFSMKFSIFNAEINLCILHGHVFIMTGLVGEKKVIPKWLTVYQTYTLGNMSIKLI